MVDVTPDPRPVSEGGIGRKKPDRGNRRRGRVTASRDEWLRLREQKLDHCRICGPKPHPQARGWDSPLELHHLVPRSLGGDDVADNLVALCRYHHDGVTGRFWPATQQLEACITEAERAYIVGKLGEGGPGRLFGVGR